MQIFILRIKVILHIRLISMVHSILLKEKLKLKATRNRLEAASHLKMIYNSFSKITQKQ